MTIDQLSRTLRSKLTPLYGEGEARSMVNLLFHALKGWSFTDLIINGGMEASPFLLEKCDDILRRLLNHEPIQYILGEASFYGMNLAVNTSTLIPRPETAELVDMIIRKNRHRTDLQVLDVGTGSGAIAIALARNLLYPDVTAIDISQKAMETAIANAAKLRARVGGIVQDVFEYEPEPDSFDIIVSNPPYIDESEKSEMEPNVLNYEPHSALFVSDAAPLIYYSRIVEVAQTSLKSGGELYFEINPRHADDLVRMMQSEGLREVEVHLDSHGKKRFISAVK